MILGTIFIPSSLLFVAFGVMGGSSIWQYRNGADGLSKDMAPPEVFFAVVDNLPYLEWLPFLIILVLAIFFITSADSASVVMGMLSTVGNIEPSRWVVVFWGLVMSGIAVVMLLLGDATALAGLQQLVIVTAVPFALVMLLIIVAWVRDLHTDPFILRHRYAEAAIRNAVIQGVERYGDNFAIEVVEAVPPAEGTGAEVDTADDRYTDWYQRRDENGEPVGFTSSPVSGPTASTPRPARSLSSPGTGTVPADSADGSPLTVSSTDPDLPLPGARVLA